MIKFHLGKVPILIIDFYFLDNFSYSICELDQVLPIFKFSIHRVSSAKEVVLTWCAIKLLGLTCGNVIHTYNISLTRTTEWCITYSRVMHTYSGYVSSHARAHPGPAHG